MVLINRDQASGAGIIKLVAIRGSRLNDRLVEDESELLTFADITPTQLYINIPGPNRPFN